MAHGLANDRRLTESIGHHDDNQAKIMRQFSVCWLDTTLHNLSSAVLIVKIWTAG